jgi:molybdopterin adenylyltransferase
MMPGYGEQMRAISLRYVPTAVLSRQTAGIRGRSLILNLPGKPKSIRETIDEASAPLCCALQGICLPACLPSFLPSCLPACPPACLAGGGSGAAPAVPFLTYCVPRLQVFASVPACVDLLEGPYIETHEQVVRAFRPPSLVRQQSRPGSEEAGEAASRRGGGH